jgi:hypothetical protein
MAMKPRKMRSGGMAKKMRGGGMVKKMRGGGMAKKPEMMKKGGVSVADLRKMAKDKGYKLVKD